MGGTVKVFGHKSPDTDTVCCAIIWAWYLNNHTTTKAIPYVLGDLNKETIFVLDHWEVARPELLENLEKGDEVIIVDTNNPKELFENINEAKILSIIDHHKLSGGLITSEPPTITIRPLASTASVIYDLMGEAREKCPKEIEGLILSCILSDTLEFRSPTTTPHDKSLAESLAKKLGVEISSYGAEMFAAKSDVGDYTDIGLIHLDSKEFQVGDKSLLVSTIETTSPDAILKRKEGIVAAINDLVNREATIDGVLFFVVDILNNESTVFVYDEFTNKLITNSFNVTIEGDVVILPGVVSRKKQILPALVI